jgi:hypothetical protein
LCLSTLFCQLTHYGRLCFVEEAARIYDLSFHRTFTIRASTPGAIRPQVAEAAAALTAAETKHVYTTKVCRFALNNCSNGVRINTFAMLGAINCEQLMHVSCALLGPKRFLFYAPSSSCHY